MMRHEIFQRLHVATDPHERTTLLLALDSTTKTLIHAWEARARIHDQHQESEAKRERETKRLDAMDARDTHTEAREHRESPRHRVRTRSHSRITDVRATGRARLRTGAPLVTSARKVRKP